MQRSLNHEETLAHVESNIQHFRERLEYCKKQHVAALQTFQLVLVTIVEQHPNDLAIYEQCEALMQRPWPELPVPGPGIRTQDELVEWLKLTMM